MSAPMLPAILHEYESMNDLPHSFGAQSSGQGSESPTTCLAAFEGEETLSATFSSVATFPPAPDEDPDAGSAGV